MQQPTELSTSSLHWSEQPEEEEELLAALSTAWSAAGDGLEYSSFWQYWFVFETANNF